MKTRFALMLALFFCMNTVCAQLKTLGKSKFTIGETISIQSKVLQENRTLNIYLPPAYNREKSYPVIYLLDGSAHEDFLHIVGLVQFYNMQFNMPECIVVGIANVDRKRDFTFPTRVADLKKEFPTTGGSARFIQFLEDELQPFIQANYSVSKARYIIGQSLGGLLATEILLRKPSMFTHYLIVSPSLWWDDESLISQAESLIQQNKSAAAEVFIAVGMQEHPTMIKDAKDLSIRLKNADNPNLKLEFVEMPNENHASILHQSISDIFKKMFPLKH